MINTLKVELIKLTKKQRKQEEKVLWFGNGQPLPTVTAEVLNTWQESRYCNEEQAVRLFLA